MAGFQKIPFPNPLAPESEKKSEKFGKAVLQAIMGATEEHRDIRNRRVAECRQFAKGQQPIQRYLNRQ